MSTKNFPQNCWYVAGYGHEVPHDGLFATEVAGEPIVLYRDTSGSIAAMADKSPHRLAPLSLGRIVGDDLRKVMIEAQQRVVDRNPKDLLGASSTTGPLVTSARW